MRNEYHKVKVDWSGARGALVLGLNPESICAASQAVSVTPIDGIFDRMPQTARNGP